MNFQASSKVITTIPQKKFQESIKKRISSCQTCNQKTINDKLDGICKKCSIDIKVYNRFFDSNIPVEYWNSDFDDSKTNKIIFDHYSEYVKDLETTFSEGKSFCYAGPNGVGKTFAASAILKKASIKGYSCLYINLYDIIGFLTQAPNEIKYNARHELNSVDFLVIDEFDSRFMNSEASSDLFGKIFEIIFRTRVQNKLPNILITNSPNIVEQFHGPLKLSIGSLISGYVEIIPIFGKDLRKVK